MRHSHLFGLTNPVYVRPQRTCLLLSLCARDPFSRRRRCWPGILDVDKAGPDARRPMNQVVFTVTQQLSELHNTRKIGAVCRFRAHEHWSLGITVQSLLVRNGFYRTQMMLGLSVKAVQS